MKIVCFTSFTFSYLNRACVLFSSLRTVHPDWKLVALICDEPPEGFELPSGLPWDETVWAKDLAEFNESWVFKHDIVEACTAVKGPMLVNLCEKEFDAIVYLDPDIAVFSDLSPVINEIAAGASVVLTPHLVDPNWDDMGILDNDLSASRTGIFNLGFVAIRTSGEGRRFAEWWRDRLVRFCYDDIPNGLFVDQKWCDHVPALFDHVFVLRDPGYNVASWNLSKRNINFNSNGALCANNNILRFWHFTKLGPLGDVMTNRYARDNFEVYEVWRWYKKQVDFFTSEQIPKGYWKYGSYECGSLISKQDRIAYRSRRDLQNNFPNPFKLAPGEILRY